MKPILDSIKSRIREAHAIGIVSILSKAANPHAVLLEQRAGIDDEVIAELLLQSYASMKAGSIDKASSLADLAQEASMIGGSSESLGDCLEWRAILLLDIHDLQEVKDETKMAEESMEILTSSLEYASQAVDVFKKAHNSEKTARSQGLISTIYHALNQLVPAIQFRLLSILGSNELADSSESLPIEFDNLSALYWAIKDEGEIEKAAQLLLENSVSLKEIVLRRLDAIHKGNYFEMLGDANWHLHYIDEAFQASEFGVEWYEKAGSQEDVCLVLCRMQDYSWKLGNTEKTIYYGERCINLAAPGEKWPFLAVCYRWLANSYEYSVRRKIDAINALHRAAELYGLENETDYYAGECLLRAALLQEDQGLYDQALLDLANAQKHTGTESTFWKTDIEMARLLFQRKGKLGEAIRHADDAVQTSVSSNGLTLRAISLHLSGILYASSGDYEKALSRFTILVNVLKEKPTTITVRFDADFITQEFPPPMAEAILLALGVAHMLGRTSDAQYFQSLRESLSQEDWQFNYSKEYKENIKENPELQKLTDGLQLFYQGESNVYSNPKQAIQFYEEFVNRDNNDRDNNDVSLIALAKRGLGIAYWGSGEVDTALNYFKQALDLFKESPITVAELECRTFLGIIEAGCGNLIEAWEQLSLAVSLAESSRSTIEDIQQRQDFFHNESNFNPYYLLVQVSFRIGKIRETLNVVELAKSRGFSDLLFQINKIPIDYQVIDQSAAIKLNRDDWIREYATKQISDNLEEDIAMLKKSINIREQDKLLRQHHQFQLTESEWQSSPLNCDEIRGLLHI